MSPKRRIYLSLVFTCICLSKSLLIKHKNVFFFNIGTMRNNSTWDLKLLFFVIFFVLCNTPEACLYVKFQFLQGFFLSSLMPITIPVPG